MTIRNSSREITLLGAPAVNAHHPKHSLPETPLAFIHDTDAKSDLLILGKTAVGDGICF
jgi:hypothetical protein